jgi:metallo-beta-lactamase class B
MKTLGMGGFFAAVTAFGLIAGDLAAAAPAEKKEELSETYRGSQRDNVEYQKVAPFKVFDNLYYVGPGFVSVWLLSTPEGAILIDAAQEPYVDHVIDSIQKSGFGLKDIKYILLTHGHLDHFGGAARIAELSGAHVVALEEDWQMMEQFAKAPPRNPARPDLAPKRDMVVKEGDTLTLGGRTLTFYKHPGHTPGSLTAVFDVFDGGTRHKAVLFGGPGPRNGVTGGQQFLESLDRIATIPGIEVHAQIQSWLASYPYPNGGILERALKLKDRKAGEPHPFVDPASWTLWLRQAREGGLKNLEMEKAKAAGK